MKKILILGAYGSTAQIVIERLLNGTPYHLKLFLRNSTRLKKYHNNQRIELIDGDVQNNLTLEKTLIDVHLVYSNIGGVDLAVSTKHIIDAMQKTHVKRLLFYSALGAIHEVPGKFGEWNEKAIQAYLLGFKESHILIKHAKFINTTEFRPAWLTEVNEIDYEITSETEPFKGTEISRASVADFIVKLIKDPTLYPNTSVGLNKPGSEGSHPSWLS